jgi:hypothetical protein
MSQKTGSSEKFTINTNARVHATFSYVPSAVLKLLLLTAWLVVKSRCHLWNEMAMIEKNSLTTIIWKGAA